MKKVGAFLALAALIVVVAAPLSFSQGGGKWKGRSGRGPLGDINRMYDPKTVETIIGEVVSVAEISMMRGRYTGVHVQLKRGKDTLQVHLGPAWFMEKHEPKIEKNDTIQVTGSLITFQGGKALIAAEVKYGEKVLRLRDEKGFPVWSGGRRAE
jgi:hypothetical protein